MRKRTVLAGILAAVLLSACAGGKEEVTASKVVNESAVAEIENSTENKAVGAEKSRGNEVTETETNTEHEPAEVGSLGSYVKGTVTEDIWESKWLGLRYQAPENATMLTEKELDEIMALGEEVLFEDFHRLELEYAKIPTVYEMMCMGEDGVTTIILTVEQLPISADAETYFTSFKEQLKETSSMTYRVIGDDSLALIGDREFQVLQCLVSYNGIEISQDYYVTIVEDRVVNLVVTYKEETAIDEILKGFTACN